MSQLGFLRYAIRRLDQHWRETKALHRVHQRHPDARIETGVVIRAPDRLTLGANALIMRGAFLDCGGAPWCDYRGSITLGDHCEIGPYNYWIGAGGIEIGNRVIVGGGNMIFSSEEDFTVEHARNPKARHSFKEVTIRDCVTLTSNIVVTPGVTIGEGAVIGAGSVVIHDVPDWTIAAGVPARVVKERRDYTPPS